MRRFYADEDVHLKAILIMFAFLMLCGTAIGSIYFMRQSGGYTGISEYLTTFFKDKVNGIDKYSVFKNVLKSNMIMLGVIFTAGFFKIGFLGVGACILRKGFITGFTAASFIRCFGIKGMVISLSYLPGMLVIIPAFVMFCSVSGSFSLKKDRFQKKIIFSYIFFTILIITIFCVAAFLEGYLTTTFMTKFAALL